MGEATGISWTTSSWSPWIGCTKVSPGCDGCYAEALDNRHRYGLKKGEGPAGAPHWGVGRPRYLTKQWDQPLRWNAAAEKAGVRRTVFPSLCDPFDNEVPEEWRHELWQLIYRTQNLNWLLLTKRIGNAAKMIPIVWVPEWKKPANIWLGASVVNQEEADRDIPKLLATPAAKRFVSYEPALGPVDWTACLGWRGTRGILTDDPVVGLRHAGIDWLIIGGESTQGRHRARPFDIAWARSTVAQCKAADVPVFVKQLGSRCLMPALTTVPRTFMPFKDRAGADPEEWPLDLRVQEFPA